MRIVDYYVAFGETHHEFTKAVHRGINEGICSSGRRVGLALEDS